MGIDEYKKQQAEYMKEYRAKQKLIKQNVEKKQKSLNTLTDAIRAIQLPLGREVKIGK